MRVLTCAASLEQLASPGAPGRRPRHAGPRPPPRHESEPAVRHVERGVAFSVRGAFFRPATVLARDLAVLAALRQQRHSGELRVLDALTGAGVRALRYLSHANAAFVHLNDLDSSSLHDAADNLKAFDARWAATREDACRLLQRLALAGEQFHVVDVDGFGSKGVPAGLALGVVRFGGLLALNSTDWAGLGRSVPGAPSLIAAYGAVVHPCPSSPEQGLRVTLGNVAQEAARRGLRVEPVVSLFAPGPAWRLLVRVYRGSSAANTQQLGFSAYCRCCGNSFTVPWASLGGALCSCGAPPTLSGPLWLGKLHDATELAALAALAEELGWSSAPPFEVGSADAAAAPQRSLGALLAVLREEADDALPPGYHTLDDVAARAGTRTPSRDAVIAALQDAGHVATRTHCADRALKTNAPWAAVLDAARAVTL